ncbi:MAG: aminoglycoside phosphotransferase family protein [Gemmataceae bacterium]
MNVPDPEIVNRLVVAAGFGPVQNMVPLAGGANNRVYRVETENGDAVLKQYFRHPDDPRDRLGAEFAFSRFAWASGIHCIPEPLISDPDTGLGLFEFVHGRRPAEVCANDVEQAVAFVRELNAARWRPLSSRLSVASEACFSIAEHLGTVARRVERLTSSTDPEASEFVRRELLPVWETTRSEVSDNAVSLGRPLEPTERCVSPSDFGFHNALVEFDDRVRFLDFEYAGWDDPAKLICDFFCQPAVPVPPRFFEPFTQAVAECFPSAPGSCRARVLLPRLPHEVGLRIRLNEFLPTGNRRRQFSLDTEQLEPCRALQLDAARVALSQLQETTA